MFPKERIKGRDKRILKRRTKKAIIDSEKKSGVYEEEE